eukprot:6193786-Pleurochrysis_carterae.AAC.2
MVSALRLKAWPSSPAAIGAMTCGVQSKAADSLCGCEKERAASLRRMSSFSPDPHPSTNAHVRAGTRSELELRRPAQHARACDSSGGLAR